MLRAPTLAKLVIALVHLARHPLQRADHAFHLDHHRAEQVRDAVVAGQLDALGVDHDDAQIVRGVVEQEAGQDGIDAHRFAGAGGAGDEQVRHVLQVGGDGMPGHILPEGEGAAACVLRWKVSLSNMSRRETRAISSLGTSMPT